jgi:hypothetical protein
MWTYAGQTRSGTWYPSGVLYTEIVVDGMIEFLLTAQVALRRLDRCVAEQELYLLQFSTRQMAQPGACTAQVRRGKILDSSALRRSFTTCHIAFGVSPSPQSLPMRFTRRKIVPALISAVAIQASSVCLTHDGTGTVRMCFPLPIKSAMTQCSSRI